MFQNSMIGFFKSELVLVYDEKICCNRLIVEHIENASRTFVGVLYRVLSTEMFWNFLENAVRVLQAGGLMTHNLPHKEGLRSICM